MVGLYIDMEFSSHIIEENVRERKHSVIRLKRTGFCLSRNGLSFPWCSLSVANSFLLCIMPISTFCLTLLISH